jgi:hypothetical protein
MTSEVPENLNENKNDYPKKKYLDINENKEDIDDCIKILTNLTKLDLNQDAINGIYLFGCDLSEETEPSEDFNAVHIMRKARKLKCFQDKIKEFVENYYISGLILMGKPKDISQKRFKFYLKIKESQEGEILEELPQNIEGKIYRFKFKRKKHDLSKMMEDKDSGEAQCVANYLNICLGKILKKCDYTKDRTSRKILYYQREEAENAVQLGLNQHYLYFPALKAVCETYEGGNIYMKLLPKHLIKTDYTYRDYFEGIGCNTLEERLEIFKNKVVNKRGITTYNQVMIKIEDVIVENPYKINFADKSGKKWSVGKYLTDKLGIKGIYDEEMPIAVRIIDKGGKLKGEERKFIHIPCQLLAVVGNVFGEKIDIKSLIQNPNEKLKEIERIRKLIEQKSIDSQDDELHNYIGTKFDPVTIDGQIIKPPLIIFGDNQKRDINSGNHEFGNIDLRETTPYSKVRNLNKIDIYTYGLDKFQYEIIWEKLEEASKELGIKFKEKPTFYTLEMHDQKDNFQNYIQNYFNECDKYYNPNLKEKKSEEKEDENKKVDFIFLFMDRRYKERFHYSIFKSVINKFNWRIPTQVILYDEKKIKKTNLSQYTNILCQMWAKQGNELYICDFGFIPHTLVIAYSSNYITKTKILTSIAISLGTKLYEYLFYSDTSESENTNISASLYSILFKALKTLGKTTKKAFKNIVFYRDAVNAKQQNFVREIEIPVIKQAISDVFKKLEEEEDIKNKTKPNPFKDTKWILILVSKMNEIKLFLEYQKGENNYVNVSNIPVGTLVDRVITNQDKYDFYLNSAESRQGTCSSTHYTVLHDDTELTASQIYKVTYYLTFLSYNTTKSIRVPAPLYFVTRRNQFTIQHLKGEIINPKSRALNISL